MTRIVGSVAYIFALLSLVQILVSIVATSVLPM